WLYKKFGKLPAMQAFLYGVKPAIIAVILAAIYPLLKKASKTKGLILLGMLSLLCCFLGVNEIFVILGAGLLYLLLSLPASGPARSLLSPSILQISYSAIFSAANMHLFWTFLKIGSILYGSGYVLFALLDAELVQKGLLSRQELIDAIAVGQFTPGPVFSAVTFIGYQINGFSGALFSTIAVFLPSFIFVWILNPLIPQMRRSVHFGNFLDAVNIASLAAILYVCYQMGVSSLQDWRSILIGLLAAALLFTQKNINSAWVILGGSLAGYLLLLI
ncbi:MAG TPA: chromate transporter, partial [Puia sp.]|nr:chromate transporter [Puia sp.]